MNNKTDIDVQYVSPLKKICMTIGELPASYLETMSYYEMLVWFVEFLKNQVIPTVNNNAEAVSELQALYEELRTYVNNYFDNLDVQDEINNKLEAMAESGQLTDIIAQYLGLAGMFVFNTVADMKLAENLVNGSKCQTLGYHSVNDGGKAIYLVRNITNSDTVDEGALIALYDQNLVAELIENDKVTPEMFGAYGDGTHDDYQAIQKAIDYIDGGVVELQQKTYLVGDTLKIHRGLNLKGISSYGEENACLKLKDNTNKTIIETLNTTHYMIVENLRLDGNKSNQTEETTALKFHGAYIGSILRNISIQNFYGTGLSLRSSDCQLDNIWVQNGYTLTNKYAIHVNPDIDVSAIYSMINANNIYVENYSNKANGNPRENQEDRADGILLYHVGSFNANEMHFEGCKVPITSSGANIININMIRSAHCGLASDENNAMIYLNSAPRILYISNMFSTLNSVYPYWVNRSFSSNNIPKVTKDSVHDDLTLPLYITESTTQSKSNYIQKSYFSNEIFANKIDSYSSPKIGIKEGSSETYLGTSGSNVVLATSKNQQSEKTIVQYSSLGNTGDNLYITDPVRIGKRGSAAGITVDSYFLYEDANNHFPVYQRLAGQNVGMNRVVTTRVAAGVPADTPWYVGEMYLDSTNKKLYVATGKSSSSDWSILN